MNEKERKSCIHTIKTLMNLAYNIHGVMDVVDADNCEKIIEMLDSGYLAGRWIPVSERLPEPWTLVLVTDSCKNVSVCQMALNPSDGWYNEYENWTYFSTSVIAWMPLPEPYQEGGEE